MSGRHVTPRSRLLDHRKVTPGWLLVHIVATVALTVFTVAVARTIWTLL